MWYAYYEVSNTSTGKPTVIASGDILTPTFGSNETSAAIRQVASQITNDIPDDGAALVTLFKLCHASFHVRHIKDIDVLKTITDGFQSDAAQVTKYVLMKKRGEDLMIMEN